MSQMQGGGGRRKCPRIVSLAGVGALFLVFVSGLSAQSSDPETLRRIIQQKNAEAAAATWAGHPGYPAPSGPPLAGAPGGSSPGSLSGNGVGGSGGSASASAGSMAPDDQERLSREAPAVKSIPARPSQIPLSQVVTTRDAVDPQFMAAFAQITPSAQSPDAEGMRTSAPLRGTVTYVGKLLFIHADDSSLRDILHQVSRLTGMIINGTLPDERVFGDQGPGRPSAVLSALLDGTNSNRLFLEDGASQVTEMILTPRLGGAVMTDLAPRSERLVTGDEKGPRQVRSPAHSTVAGILDGSHF